MESPVRIENAQIISLNRDHKALGVRDSEWREHLNNAVPDEVVGIKHQEISGNSDCRIHVAAIPKQVGCHYHAIGEEDYAVVEGSGILFFGKVENGEVAPISWRSIAVSTGDSFVIPEGFAHQLRRTGQNDLTILFRCPDSHLDDKADRHMLPDAPISVGGLTA